MTDCDGIVHYPILFEIVHGTNDLLCGQIVCHDGNTLLLPIFSLLSRLWVPFRSIDQLLYRCISTVNVLQTEANRDPGIFHPTNGANQDSPPSLPLIRLYPQFRFRTNGSIVKMRPDRAR